MYRVLIRKCDEYDPHRIGGIIKEGMEDLGVKPSGKVLLKPNAVIAHPEFFPYAFTRKEFLEGAITAAKGLSKDLVELSVGERSGITIPTRFCFKNAGYGEVTKRYRVTTFYFDECKHTQHALKKTGRLRDRVFVAKPVAECNFMINLPKFKAHPWTRLTLSLKNLIGIQDDRHRLVDHNSFLEHKIADLQEVVPSGFIAVDGITAGQEMMLTPSPFAMGAIVMGTNSCAVDTVGCHMVHVNPEDLIHLRYASERGFGPMDLDQIEVTGDYPLEEVREKTRGFKFCLERVDEYFNRHKGLSCTVGSFPEKHSPDYCWGGCPGALQEAMKVFKDFYPHMEKSMKKIHYVVGRVEGPLGLSEDERVLFAGDCTGWKGKINGKEVEIKGNYRSSKRMDESKTRSNDLILKTLSALWNCFRQRSSEYIQARGCTVSVAEHVHYISFLGRMKNPNFDRRLVFPLFISYARMRLGRLINRILG